MADQEHRKHMETLKADSEKIKKMVKSQNYSSRQIDQIFDSSETFRLPQPSHDQRLKPRKPSFVLKINPASQSKQSQNKKASKQWTSRLESQLRRQIMDLRNQNAVLQKSNSRFIEEINDLKKQLSALKAQSVIKRKGAVNYFSFDENVNVFITKSPVMPESLESIEYQGASLNLHQSKINIEFDERQDVYELKHLTGVEYNQHQNLITLVFENKKIWIYLYFNDSQIERKFDLSLFINWKIVNSLQTHLLFKNQFMNMKKRTTVRFSKPITQKSQEYYNDDYSHNPLQQIDELNDQQKQSQKIQYPTSFQNKITKKDQQAFQTPAIFIQQQSKNQEQSKNDMTKQHSQTLLNFQKALFSSDEIKPDGSHLKQTQHIQEKSQSPEQKDKRIMQSLIQGYRMVKHAKKGYKSHEKYITLLPSTMELQFEDVDSKSSKKIDVGDIVDMNKQIGEGIKKHAGKNIKAENCLVIKLKGGNVIELTSNSVEEVDSLIQELSHLISQKGKLKYK